MTNGNHRARPRLLRGRRHVLLVALSAILALLGALVFTADRRTARQGPLTSGALAAGQCCATASPPAAPVSSHIAKPAASPDQDCAVAPADSIWRTRVDRLPSHPLSARYVDSIGADQHLHPDFGSGTWEGKPFGIPITRISPDQATTKVAFEYADESDPGPYPIPRDARIENGPDGDGDRHVLLFDRESCKAYELYSAYPQPGGTWKAGSGAVFDLRSHQLRPDGWTSADAAGLPILPGLVRLDDVKTGRIDHALRITVPRSQAKYVWPARHQASSDSDTALPPMGLRLRLKKSVSLDGLAPQARVVAEALQTYGAMVADNGSAWYVSGTEDEGWHNEDLATLGRFTGTDFEAVDVSGLMVSPDSSRARL